MRLICLSLLTANLTFAAWHYYQQFADKTPIELMPTATVPTFNSDLVLLDDLPPASIELNNNDITVTKVGQQTVRMIDLNNDSMIANATNKALDTNTLLNVENATNTADSLDNINEAPSNECVAYGPFSDKKDVDILIERLQALEAKNRLELREIDGGPNSYWVYLPPFTSSSAALEQLRQLQRQNIDSFIFTDGEFAGGISVGLFSSITRARSKKRSMERAGYSVKISELRRTQDVFWLITESDIPLLSWLNEIQKKKIAKESAKCIADNF